MNMRGRVRVAYVNHTGAVSGAEVVLMNMVRGLDRSAYEPVVICPAEGGLARQFHVEGVPCMELPAVQARFTWRLGGLWKAVTSVARAIGALRRTLWQVDPEIVHANSVRAGIVVSLACIASGRKVVWHVHDNLPRHPLSTVIRIAALVLRPDRVIAVSQATAQAFRGHFSFAESVVTIHNGVDLIEFPLKGAERSALRFALGVPEGAFLVCAVGQICARKGLLELIEAFTIAHTRTPDLHLIIAGSVLFEHEKPYLDRLYQAAANPSVAGSIRFIGQIQDVSVLLRAADLLVLNSHEEPFGLVLIEAMSSGTPVLATRTGGIPEIVRDTENGWLVDKGDTAGLARKLLELAGHKELLDRAARQAHETTCPQFSVERFQAQIHDCYAGMLAIEKHALSGRPQWARPANE
ncbi:MAG: glycosyltransferase family 4 protein [Terracidiphilus sp.]